MMAASADHPSAWTQVDSHAENDNACSSSAAVSRFDKLPCLNHTEPFTAAAS
jgi:hypothetical protein